MPSIVAAARSRSPGASGGSDGADAPEHEAGRADALEVQVARKVVAARPQRLERRRQPRLELDEGSRPAARCPCAPTPARARAARSSRAPVMRWTRTTMRSERSRSSRTSTKPAISTFQAAACSTGWATSARLTVAVSEARRGGRECERQREGDRPVAREAPPPRPRRPEQRRRRPELRLPVGGEIEDDPEAEGDGEPGHEPSRPDFGQRPGPQPLADRARSAGKPSGHASTRPAGRPPAGRHVASRPRAIL